MGDEADAAAGVNETKRQRRKVPNAKQAWPQHPKIQSAETRAKAYVRAAGLQADPLALDDNQRGFGRQLGSADARTRHRSVKSIKDYLKSRSAAGNLSEMDLLKLWKCLWYTLYMADRVPVQEELSKLMTELLWSVVGTPEQDEYAGDAYLEMCLPEDLDLDEFEGYEADTSMLNEEPVDEDDIEIEEDSDDSVIDFEAKQLELLAEEEEVESEPEIEDKSEDDSDTEQPALAYTADSNEEEEDSDSIDDPDGDYDDEEEGEEDPQLVGHCAGAHLASLLFRTFLRTVVREWTNMDKYRIDKFYTCIRLMMKTVYSYLKSREFHFGIVRQFNETMFDEALSKTPNGVRYHLIDVCIEELAEAVDGFKFTEAHFCDVLEPFFAMLQNGANHDDSVQARAVEGVFEKFLEKYSVFREPSDVPQFKDVRVTTIADFLFELGSDPETPDKYRGSIYALHKKFKRRIQEVGEEHDVQVDIDDSADLDLEPDAEPAQEASHPESMDFETTEDDAEDNEVTQKETSETQEKKKEKKKKKKKKKSKDREPTETVNVDSDQTATEGAGKESKQSKAKRPREDSISFDVGADADDDASPKRVKFGNTARKRSYKASMQGLHSLQSPVVPDKSPENGILLNKDATIKIDKAALKYGVKKDLTTISGSLRAMRQSNKANRRAKQHQKGKKGKNKNKFQNRW